MANLQDKIENVLNETRILVLGIQILIGFGFRTFFEPGFEQMAPYTQRLQLMALGLMLLGFGVLMIPAPYHRIVLHGRNTGELHRLATITVSAGLLPTGSRALRAFSEMLRGKANRHAPRRPH